MDLNSLRADDDLFKAYLCGDMSAFTVLYRRYAASMISFSRLIVKDFYVAEEAVQESFQIVHEKRDQYVLGSNFYCWLKTICRNKAYEMVRRSGSVKLRHHEFEEFLKHSGSAAPSSVEGMSEDVFAVVGQLLPSDQEILRMYFFNGLGYPEIATKINSQIATARYRVSAAKAKFKQAWELRAMV